jgi:hypothetical protein
VQRVLLPHWELYDESAATRLVVPHPNVTAMIFDNLIDDSQPQAGTLFFCGKSRFEYSNASFRRHAATIVGNFKVHCIPGVIVGRRYPNLAAVADSGNGIV